MKDSTVKNLSHADDSHASSVARHCRRYCRSRSCLEHDPEAVIGVFLSDHYYSDDDSFRLTIRSTEDWAEQYPNYSSSWVPKVATQKIEYGRNEHGSDLADARVGLLYR